MLKKNLHDRKLTHLSYSYSIISALLSLALTRILNISINIIYAFHISAIKLHALDDIPIFTAFNPQNAIDQVSYLHEITITITM